MSSSQVMVIVLLILIWAILHEAVKLYDKKAKTLLEASRIKAKLEATKAQEAAKRDIEITKARNEIEFRIREIHEIITGIKKTLLSTPKPEDLKRALEEMAASGVVLTENKVIDFRHIPIRDVHTDGLIFECCIVNNLTLINCVLKRSRFAFSRLLGTEISASRLSESDFAYADMRGIILKGTSLEYADLTRAVLRGADLSEANLQWAILRGADLSDAYLNNARLFGADFSFADLRSAKGLEHEYLATTKTLYGALIDDYALSSLKDKCPHLFQQTS